MTKLPPPVVADPEGFRGYGNTTIPSVVSSGDQATNSALPTDAILEFSYDFESKSFQAMDLVNDSFHYLEVGQAEAYLRSMFGIETAKQLFIVLCSGRKVRIDPESRTAVGIRPVDHDPHKAVGQFLSPNHIQREMDATSTEDMILLRAEMLGIGYVPNNNNPPLKGK